jgi:hypothetical protein
VARPVDPATEQQQKSKQFIGEDTPRGLVCGMMLTLFASVPSTANVYTIPAAMTRFEIVSIGGRFEAIKME